MRWLKILPGLLFGLVFSGGGLSILNETSIPTWQSWYAMQNWQLNYAELISVDGQDNHTKAHYRYRINGTHYKSDRVYAAEFNDSIGSYHRDLQQQLKAKLRAAQSVPIWVDPFNPQNSVIDREMRWGLFALMSGFCSIFILVGLVICYASIKSANAGKTGNKTLSYDNAHDHPDAKSATPTRDDLRGNHPEHTSASKSELPDWQSRKQWQSSKIRSGAKRNIYLIWAFAVIWTAISAPLIFALPKELSQGNNAMLIAMLFPLIGVGILYKAIQMTRQFSRYGFVLFEMDPYPGGIGGNVGGRIDISRLSPGLATGVSAKMRVKLECVYSYSSGSGKQRSRKESIKWAEQGKPAIKSAGHGIRLSFRFDIPDNLPEADVKQSGDYYFWRLTLDAKMPTTQLTRRYNIPVFKTGETSRFVRHDISSQVAQQREIASDAAKQAITSGDFDLPGLSRAMRLTQRSGDISMRFPMFRNKILTMFCVVFGGGFGFASYMMISSALDGGSSGFFIGLFSVPFVVVSLIALIAMFYLLFNTLETHIQKMQVTVTRRLLFMPISHRVLNASDILYLGIKRSGSTGQGVEKIEHFKLFAFGPNSKKITLAEDLDGEDVTGHFCDYLAKRLNIESRH